MQFSTLCLVWPSLLLTYLGQAAYLTKHPEKYFDTYYSSVPHAVFWPMFILAVLAAIIASQVHCNTFKLSVCMSRRFTAATSTYLCCLTVISYLSGSDDTCAARGAAICSWFRFVDLSIHVRQCDFECFCAKSAVCCD